MPSILIINLLNVYRCAKVVGRVIGLSLRAGICAGNQMTAVQQQPTAAPWDRRPWLLLGPALGVVTLLLVIPACFVFVYSFWLRTAVGGVDMTLTLHN